MQTTDPTDYLWQEAYATMQQAEAALQGLAVYMQTLILAVAVLAAVGLVMVGLSAWREGRAALITLRPAAIPPLRRDRLPAGADEPVGPAPMLQAA